MPDDTDQERTAVRTYVPRHQKAAWKAAAAELDMSLSEFVASMVQAGHRGFFDRPSGAGRESSSDAANPGSNGLETRLLDVLDTEEYRSWDRIRDAMTEEYEERINAVLSRLMNEGSVIHDPREEGYRLANGDDE